ncbi:MAG: hypothetical protein H0W02_10225 [Ktedonobacteraceae bacterium]|nr:hypothetical protein [Ktedonobacteraceae bacterium]
MQIPTPTLPQTLTIVLPFIVTLVSGVLSQQRLPAWANALIAGTCVVLASLGAVLLGQGFSRDLVADFLLIAGYVAALMASPLLAPLHEWLTLNTPSPIAAMVPKAAPTPMFVPPIQRASRSATPKPPAADLGG